MPLYPWMPIGALIVYCFLLFEMGQIPLLISFGFFILGYIIYWSYSRIRVQRKSALMHIVERISAKELKSKTLEKELREIVIERDNIIEDRFDRLIRDCEVLDITQSMNIEDVFKNLSSILAKRLHIDSSIIY